MKSSLSEHRQQVVRKVSPRWSRCVSGLESIPKTHPADPRGDPGVRSSITKAHQDKAVPQPCAGVPWAPLSAGTLLSVGNEKAVPGMIQTKMLPLNSCRPLWDDVLSPSECSSPGACKGARWQETHTHWSLGTLVCKYIK